MTKSDFVKIKNICPLKNIGRKYLQSNIQQRTGSQNIEKHSKLNSKKTNKATKKTGKVFEQRYIMENSHTRNVKPHWSLGKCTFKPQ